MEYGEKQGAKGNPEMSSPVLQCRLFVMHCSATDLSQVANGCGVEEISTRPDHVRQQYLAP